MPDILTEIRNLPVQKIREEMQYSHWHMGKPGKPCYNVYETEEVLRCLNLVQETDEKTKSPA